jgi:hypothetical protein
MEANLISLKDFAPSAYLFHGDTGSGKTYTAVSSFWDVDRQEAICNGRWVTFGREDNEALGVPEELRKRFIPNPQRPLQFLLDFLEYLKAVHDLTGGPDALDALVIDGWTEMSNIYALTKPADEGSSLKFWGGWKDALLAILQMANPTLLGCHILATARVEERRTGIKKKGHDTGTDATDYFVQPDPEYIEAYKYHPAITGKWARFNLGNYHPYIFYMSQEVEQRMVGVSKRMRDIPVHYAHLLATGDFRVKNWYEREWIRFDLPEQLTNPTFADILTEIGNAKRLREEAIAALKTK